MNENIIKRFTSEVEWKKKIAEHILATLEKDEVLLNKTLANDKNIDGVCDFIYEEARKTQVNSCAAMSHEEVYGLATHFLDEDSLKQNAVKAVKAKVETVNNETVLETKKTKKEKQHNQQISLF